MATSSSLVVKNGLIVTGSAGTSVAVVSSTGLAITGTLDSTSTATVNSANSTSVSLVVKGETGNGIRQRFIGQAASGQYNWQIGTSITVAGNFEIIPSTAVDGTTFSTPVGKFSTTGLAVTGTLSNVGLFTNFTGAAKTVNAGSNVRLFQTNEAVNYAALQGSFVGAATAADRVFRFQTVEQGVANDGIISFQPDGGKLGIGTASPQRLFTIANGGPVVEIDPAGISGTDPIYFNYNRTTSTYLTPEHWALAHTWNFNGGTFGMKLDSSGNLGIGMSSPSVKLHVQGQIRSANVGNTVYTQIENDGVYATGTDLYLLAPASRFMAFYTNSLEKMRLDSSGNLGIGTSSPAVRLQSNIATSGLPVTSGTTQTNGAFRISANSATSGVLDFGPNSAAPWIQATDRDDLSQTYNILLNPNGGNVGIGTSSPAAKLQVAGGNIRLDNNQGLEWGGANNYIYGNETTDFIALATNGAEAVRINASQNVGIGTSSPAAKLDVNGGALIQGLTVGRGAGAVASNTVVGAGALAANTSGSLNVAVGSSALAANTSGAAVVAVGSQALKANTTGSDNTVVGRDAGLANTTGGSLSALG